MSKEKNDVLRGFGSEIIRTRTELAFDDYDSHISQAYRRVEQNNNCILLGQ